MSVFYSDFSEWSDAIRKSTIKRLKRVPVGMENWKLSVNSMSFTDTMGHLIDSDNWMIKKITIKDLAPIDGYADSVKINNRDEFDKLIEDLIASGERRKSFIETLDEKKLYEKIFDERFGKEVTVWWIIVRGNFDHEIHHRGTIAAGLRVIEDSAMH